MGRLGQRKQHISILLSRQDRDLSELPFALRSGWPILSLNGGATQLQIHRLIMSRRLQRPLTSRERVTVVNGNKQDLRRSNLTLIGDHT